MKAFNWLEEIIGSLLGCTNGALRSPDKDGPSRVLVELEPEALPTEPALLEVAALATESVEIGIFGNTSFPYLDDAIKITGQFEGQGYGQVTGDFDKMGMSVGILQWNFGQGSLQRILLQTYRKRYGKIAKLGIFPDGMLVDALAEMTPERGLSFVRKRMLNGTKVRPEWKSAWQEFLTTPQVMNLQREGCIAIATKAQVTMLAWGMNSRRAFCFFFDVVVQNGSMKSVKKTSPTVLEIHAIFEKADKKNRSAWVEPLRTATSEQLILVKAAYDRAKLSNPTYFQDVYSRKGTIALGRGFVHGRHWDLFPSGT
jgi:hypothetical protein